MRRWRDYETAAGRRPVKEFIKKLSWEEDAAADDRTGEAAPARLGGTGVALTEASALTLKVISCF